MDLACGLPEQAAEAARITETQAPAIVQHDIDVVVRARRRIAIQHAQAAGHAQMQQRAATVDVQQQVLRAPANVGDAGAVQTSRHGIRNRPAQIMPAQHHLAHRPPQQMRRNAAPGGFYLGKLRHR